MLLPGARLRRLRALARQTGSSVVHQAVADAEPQEDWGEGEGSPVTEPGWQPKPGQFAIDDRRKTRVGNYSGGYEQFYPHRVIQADPSAVSPLSAAADAKYQDSFEYRFGLERLTVHDFATRFPLTGLMAARRGQVLYEHYFKGRDATMRLQSWSMAKSITSLLLGICIDRGLIASVDDPVELYAPALRDTFHGGISIRHLGNMASGAEILHASEDYGVLYPKCFTDADSDISALVSGWNAQAKGRQGEPGGMFNYNELCPLAVGMAIREVTGMSLSEFAEDALWQPMGAEADATWTTDSKGAEFNCVGFGARLRDWARVGQLIAQRGEMNGHRIVSEAWIDEITSWEGDSDQNVLWAKGKHANSTALLEQGLLGLGYKTFMWHQRPDGTQPTFSGHNGQMVDMPSETVLVMTGVSEEGPWLVELKEILQATINLRS